MSPPAASSSELAPDAKRQGAPASGDASARDPNSRDASGSPRPARPLRFNRRMTSAEALMWTVERDPILRSSFLSLTLLEGSPDFDRFRRRMAAAVENLPRLKQRVRGGTPLQFSWPEWVDDGSFDLDYHVRRVALPKPGSIQQLLDLCAVEAQENFDLARPLWTIWIVEGLRGGRSALLSKMHHTITDGVGGVRLSAQFIDIEPNAPDPQAEPRQDDSPGSSSAAPDPGRGLLPEPVRLLTRTARAAAKTTIGSMLRPGDALETARSLIRQALVTESARSPLWAGKRGLARRFEIFSFDLDEAKQAAHTLGGTLNDLFVAGVAGGVGAYHRAMGAEAGELRMTMPVNTRQDRSAGGNSFAPVRVLIPCGIEDPVERFRAVHDRLSTARGERALNSAEALAGVLTGLPAPVLVRLARQQIETVDFATSNVRGAPFDLYVAGARILSNHPFGPTAGTACNVTVLSYKGSMDVGVNCDAAAISDPALLRRCIEAEIERLIKAGA